MADVRDAAHAAVTQLLTHGEPMPAWETVDLAKLEGALDAPRQVPFGFDPYPTLEAKAAVLLYGMTKNHAWSNGNKRMALITTVLFLALNGREWAAESDEVFAHIVWVAASPAALRKQVLVYLTAYFERRTTALTAMDLRETPAGPTRG